MYAKKILSRPDHLHIDEQEEDARPPNGHSLMSGSSYSYYDAGICPDSYQHTHGDEDVDSTDEVPPMASLKHNSLTLPLRPTENGTRYGSRQYPQTPRPFVNGAASVVMLSSTESKRAGSETQTLFPRSASRKNSNFTRNCVLCLLIFAVFFFALVVALFIGHWASEGYITRLEQNGSLSNLTKAAKAFFFPEMSANVHLNTASLTSTASTLQSVSSTGGESTTVTATPHVLSTHRNLTVFDVYPPRFTEDYAPAFHRSSNSRFPDDPVITLPKNVVPVHYDLNFDFTEFSTGEHVHGNVSILFESFGNSTDDEVVFHASSNIFIHRLRIRHDGHPAPIRSVKRQFKRDLVRVQLKQRLKATWYTLEMEFRTRICHSPLEGAQCVRSIPNSSSEIVASFTTKFEPAFARTFLPCWDEPQVKTTFNISVRHLRNTTVLTNSAPQHRGSDVNATNEIVTTRFMPTHKMPVYLLAFVVGDFVPLEMRTDRNMPLTLWMPRESVASSHFAANFSPVMFDRVEEELGVLYPLTKMDFVAAKGFPVEGMENFGLIIYNENAILLSSTLEDRNVSVDAAYEQYKVEKIITHEIVHQWFGNLVTMYDWPELWLNEGFASYFVYSFLNDEHPYLTDNEYYIRLIELLDRQTSTSQTPLIRRLETMEEINLMFDGLQLYTKGAVVVKMIKDLLGAYDFQAGISRYLKKNAYKSVTRESLWASMPTYADHGAENEKLGEVMESWLVNEGMPEVIISRNYEDHTIRITQRACNQNRYIIFLNDAAFHTEAAVGRAKRSSNTAESDAAINNIERDDELVGRLDAESETIQSAFQESNITDNATFDDSLFLQSTSLNPRRDLFEFGSVRNQKLLRRKNKSSRKSIQHRVSPFTHDTEVLNNRTIANNKRLPLFSNRARHSAILRKERVPSATVLRKESGEEFLGSQGTRRHVRRKMHSSPSTWSIPFSYWFGSTQSNMGQVVRQFWVHNETIRFVDVELEADDYILANPHWVYPFKINYDLDNWKMLIKQLHKNPDEIAIMSRAQLIVDAQTYLKQSGVPYLYLKLLRYLSNETDLGVLLIGLDAVHAVVDMFSATAINGPLLMYFTPVIKQFDRMLEKTSSNPEHAAVWLLSPQRLTKLYQLRCIANFGSCRQNQQVENWLLFPTALSGEHHQQVTAICHHLFTQAGPKEVALVAGLLRQATTQWAVVIKLATCVRDETLIEEAVNRIIKSRNAVVYATVLQSSYSIQYNRKFREMYWKAISEMNLHERQLLFAVNTGKSDLIARLLIHAVRGSEELDAVIQLLPKWPAALQIHIDFVRRKFDWIERTAVKQVQNFLIQEV